MAPHEESIQETASAPFYLKKSLGTRRDTPELLNLLSLRAGQNVRDGNVLHGETALFLNTRESKIQLTMRLLLFCTKINITVSWTSKKLK